MDSLFCLIQYLIFLMKFQLDIFTTILLGYTFQICVVYNVYYVLYNIVYIDRKFILIAVSISVTFDKNKFGTFFLFEGGLGRY